MTSAPPAKRKTTINISAPVFDAAKAQAATEDRDFGFIVERALVRELGIGNTLATPRHAELIAAARKVGGTDRALKILTGAKRRHSRA